MPENPVISNNSPLVALWHLDRLSLLRDLYTEVWIPQEVEREFLGTKKKSRQEALNNAPWIKTVDLADSEKASVYDRLDSGEAAVLALAHEHETRLIIIDEKKARQEILKIGLPFIGTVGILLEAKEEGLIGEIKPLLITLQEKGIYLDESLITYALGEAGEI
jgi:predicted nucleic acid-binding protein